MISKASSVKSKTNEINKTAMNQNLNTIKLELSKHKKELQAFGVQTLSVFGSTARNQAKGTSDIDFLVSLEPKTLRNYMGLKFYLENVFQKPVDLVTFESLNPIIKEQVLIEAQRVT